MGDRRAEIVDAARLLLETEGAEGLTMRALAAAIGVRAPSLYKHVRSKEELEAALAAVALAEIAVALERPRTLAGLAQAYRAWALAHPQLYRLATDRPLSRGLLPEGLEERAAAPLVRVTGDRGRARVAWGFAHGMVMLELAGRFPPDADVDRAWKAGIKALA